MNAIIQNALNIFILILSSYTFKNHMTDSQTPPSENGGTIQQDKKKNTKKNTKPYTGYKTTASY